MIQAVPYNYSGNWNDPERPVLNTTSRSDDWAKAFSPFFLGPVELYAGYVAENVENGWQFTKVYQEHCGSDQVTPTMDYWRWAINGWRDKRAQRYPMSKGAIPKFSYWDGEVLSYVEARKRIYVPLYTQAVKKIPEFKRLVKLTKDSKAVYLRDFDAYITGHSFEEVINDPIRKMGHAFVLAELVRKEIENES